MTVPREKAPRVAGEKKNILKGLYHKILRVFKHGIQ
jgi:hypothetical protein